MTPRAFVVALLAAVLGLTSCGDGRVTTMSGLGACDATHVDGEPAAEFLSQPGAWLRVRALDLSSAKDKTLATTEAFRGTYAVVGGDAAQISALGSDPVETVTMHGSTAKDAEVAIALKADVYIRVGAREARRADYAIALTASDFAFLGYCQRTLRTDPLKRTFGASAVETVRGFVGKPGADIRKAFPTPPARSPSGVVVLNPETAPRELLAALDVYSFRLTSVPPSWTGPYTLCTRIPQGWSDCIDLSSTENTALTVDAYVDPRDPVVEVWLANEAADLANPIARLGTLDLMELAHQSKVALEAGLRIRVSLDPASSARSAVVAPTQASDDIIATALERVG